jgi:aspartate aminotransferase-like enzyme
MKKFRLMTPGPTTIPERVLSKLGEPIIHHRTSLFEAEFKSVQDNLKWLFQTKQPVLSLACTGTGAMDATVSNLFSPGDEVLTVNAGKFGERWTKIATTYNLGVHEVYVERGFAVEVGAIETVLEANPQIKAVLFQASETSTGALMPVEAIAKLCRKFNVLCVCDGITAVGIFDLPMDAWGIDVLITGSQKALMLPPGLAFVSFSDRAWHQAELAELPKFYFDLKREKKGQEKQNSAWTPAISLIIGANESLSMLKEMGLPEVFKTYARLGAATRAAVAALGLETFAKMISPVLTTVKVPSSFSLDQGKKIQKIMQEKHGVIIMGGQDELVGKILRLSHFGYCDIFDVISEIAALELTLDELGHPVQLGAGMGAALKSWKESS